MAKTAQNGPNVTQYTSKHATKRVALISSIPPFAVRRTEHAREAGVRPRAIPPPRVVEKRDGKMDIMDEPTQLAKTHTLEITHWLDSGGVTNHTAGLD